MINYAEHTGDRKHVCYVRDWSYSGWIAVFTQLCLRVMYEQMHETKGASYLCHRENTQNTVGIN